MRHHRSTRRFLPFAVITGWLLMSSCATATYQTPEEREYARTLQLVKALPNRGVFLYGHRGSEFLVLHGDQGTAHDVLAAHGIVLPALRSRLSHSPDTLVMSAPVTIGDRQVVYRMRHSATSSRHIVLDVLTADSDGLVVIEYGSSGFAREAWAPINAIGKALVRRESAPSRAVQWRPKGCGANSTLSYCS